ncbi:hypothetical protein Ahy_A10g049684 [Arachis hypogaea]|uniref:MULE transposase domain-containing protein n=1 Tax=Arachis hypogaea TaxID=3818 RepID=A0A445B7N5_ARAHY|nr:hypothetical protein Ahy_A10g049684 [Arachis hypogaea]
MTKQLINQSIHCNQEDFQRFRVKAPTRKNTIAAVGCRARIYAKFAREKHDWVLLKVELNHSHPCSTKKVVHYHENMELTMHVKCIIKVNDKVGIRPNKTFLVLANEVGWPSNLGFSGNDIRNYISSRLRSTNVNADVKMLNYFMHGLPFVAFIGVNHHGKPTLLGYTLLGSEEILSFKWVFTQWLKYMGTAPKGIITNQCKSMFGAIKKVLPNTQHLLSSYKVNEMPSYYVLSRWSKNIKRKHTYIKSSHDIRRSDESHNIFRGLWSHFYNVAQEFMNCDDEADMLHDALEDAKAKLVDYRARMRNKTVVNAYNSIATGTSTVLGTEDIQAPSKVTTKGYPKGKRLGYELDKSIRKSMQRKRKSLDKDNRLESTANQDSEASAQ